MLTLTEAHRAIAYEAGVINVVLCSIWIMILIGQLLKCCRVFFGMVMKHRKPALVPTLIIPFRDAPWAALEHGSVLLPSKCHFRTSVRPSQNATFSGQHKAHLHPNQGAASTRLTSWPTVNSKLSGKGAATGACRKKSLLGSRIVNPVSSLL